MTLPGVKKVGPGILQDLQVPAGWKPRLAGQVKNVIKADLIVVDCDFDTFHSVQEFEIFDKVDYPIFAIVF